MYRKKKRERESEWDTDECERESVLNNLRIGCEVQFTNNSMVAVG